MDTLQQGSALTFGNLTASALSLVSYVCRVAGSKQRISASAHSLLGLIILAVRCVKVCIRLTYLRQ